MRWRFLASMSVAATRVQAAGLSTPSVCGERGVEGPPQAGARGGKARPRCPAARHLAHNSSRSSCSSIPPRLSTCNTRRTRFTGQPRERRRSAITPAGGRQKARSDTRLAAHQTHRAAVGHCPRAHEARTVTALLCHRPHARVGHRSAGAPATCRLACRRTHAALHQVWQQREAGQLRNLNLCAEEAKRVGGAGEAAPLAVTVAVGGAEYVC